MPSRYDANTKAKAVRLVREHRADYPTEYAAITAVAGRLGMSPETLRLWIRQDEVDSGTAAGVTTTVSDRSRSADCAQVSADMYAWLPRAASPRAAPKDRSVPLMRVPSCATCPRRCYAFDPGPLG